MSIPGYSFAHPQPPNPSIASTDPGGGGSGLQQYYQGSGDPNGVITPETIPAEYYDETNFLTYRKNDTAATNTGWTL